MTRWDETWHRLIEWTNGQGPSERLAAQILLHEKYKELDPSHSLGGKDGGKDALCTRDGKTWLMAAYFPRGQQDFGVIKTKFDGDLSGVAANGAAGLVFVTNQELKLSERKALTDLAGAVPVMIYHLERLTAILDQPAMAAVRKQFLGIDDDQALQAVVSSVKTEVTEVQRHLEAVQTGGDTFCYCMFYHFDLALNIARNFVLIRKGNYPLYDVRFRLTDMATNKDILRKQWGELNSCADFQLVRWPLSPAVYYRFFFHARNGSWHQDLILKRSVKAECWLAATRVSDRKGKYHFEHIDSEFPREFGSPVWKS